MSPWPCPVRSRRAAALVPIVLLAAALPAARVPAEEADSRLRVVDYRPDLVLSLTGFVGYHVHFEFEPDERFVNLGAGDTAAIDVGAEGNHLLLKPKSATVGTNLTILTNRRVYFIDFRALNRAPRPGEATYSVAYRYAGDGPPAPAAAQANALDHTLAQAPAVLNRDYWYCGSPALRPTAASDDGLQIRLAFPPQVELPAVYVRAADGAESLVNTHAEGEEIVIHRLAERLVLRRGALVGCIVNRGGSGTARRPASGTVNDGVRRDTREVSP